MAKLTKRTKRHLTTGVADEKASDEIEDKLGGDVHVKSEGSTVEEFTDEINFKGMTVTKTEDGKIEVEAAGGGASTLYSVSADISLTAEASKDAEITAQSDLASVVRGKLYIGVDPGAPFNESVTLEFFSHPDRKGHQLLWGIGGNLVYTELAAAATPGDASFTVDDESGFATDMLMKLPASGELQRIDTVGAGTITPQDLVEQAGSIDDSVSNVIEFGGRFMLPDDSASGKIYVRLSFSGAQTVSAKLELDLV